MSVVNKMLQDLEARQVQPDEIHADYQPPEKKQSKVWMVLLLVLAVAAIGFALFSHQTKDEINQLPIIQNVASEQVSRPAIAKKMLNSEKPVTVLDAHKIENVNKQQNKVEELPLLKAQQTENHSPAIIPTNTEQVDAVHTKALPAVSNVQKTVDKSDGHSEPEQKSSFAMTNSSQANQSASLKQRVSESLENNNIPLATTLLNQLINTEPNNLAARKKLASLHFAQGNYQQSKFLLLQGIEQQPQQSDLKLMLARLYVVQKKSQDAMALLLGVEPEPQIQIEFLAYRAALAQQLKQSLLAKSDYQKLTQMEPSNAKWWLGLAVVEDQTGNVNNALAAYRRADNIGELDFSVNEFVQQRILVLMEGQ